MSFENFGKCLGKTQLWSSFKQIASLQITALALPSMFAKFWKIPEITCAVEFIFDRSRRYQVHYQRSLHAVLIMSVLRKKTQFYKGGSNREEIVIAAGGPGEGAPPAGRFSHYGDPSFPSNVFLSS